MVVQVGDQKRLNEQVNDGNKPQFGGNKPPYQKGHYHKQNAGPFKKKNSEEEKRKLKCTHRQEMGCEADEYFKLHGVSDWYKKYKESQGQNIANYVDSNTEVESNNDNGV